MLELGVDGSAVVGLDAAVWSSLLYAIVEGAAQSLEIARDDIDGTLYRAATGHTSLMLYDTVPGGAGHVRAIAEHLDKVLEAAWRRVHDCECGPETSCYRCLRVFRNQRLHEQLRRGAAADVLGRLLGKPTSEEQTSSLSRLSVANLTALSGLDRRFLLEEAPGEVFERVPSGQLDLYEGRVVLASVGSHVTVGRLWLSRDGDIVSGAGVANAEDGTTAAGDLGMEVLAASV
jgi:hypothetical protein